MSHMFSSPSIPAPAPAPAAPTPTTPAVTQASLEAAREAAQAMGARSTLLTGGQGTGSPTVSRKTLLGQ